ncbi:MAG: efflux RND transporter permease subunit [Pseudomonadota bacterium]
MNGFISWWAKNHIAANLLMIACFVAGILAFTRLERELDPSATFSGANVSVAWPGASPQEIEEQIILRIEEAVSDIDGVEHIDSTAREGSGTISVEGDEGIDQTFFLNEIKNRVDGISTLPQDSFPPIVSQWRNRNPGAFMALYGDLDLREHARLAREIRNELSQLPGGSPLVDLWGEPIEEVSIEVSEEALRRFNLTFDDVARAIRNSSLNLAGGQVRTETGNLQIAARNLADTEEEFSRIVVRQNPDGSILRVSDVANVVDGFEDRNRIRTLNGKSSISIAVQSPAKSNVTELSKVINNYVEEKNKELDGKAELYIWFDAAEPFNGQLNLVASNALLGLLLVLIVLMLFLRPAVAFWVAIGIGVSFVGAFILMPMTGVTLNFLSIFGFLLVIGVVVDDAIIVGESIHSAVEEGHKGPDAAIFGTQLVIKPVFFAVLTTMIAFSPWLFIGGNAAQFTRQISLTIIFALTFSLVEAFMILPAHLSHMKPQNKNGLYYRLQRGFSEGIVAFAEHIYQPLIKLALRLRYFTVASFVVAFMVAFALLAQGWISFKFMPEIQGTFISLNVRLPEGSSFTRTKQIYDEVSVAANKLKAELGDDREGEDFVKSIYIAADEGEVTSYVTITEARFRKQSTEEIAELFRDKLGPIPDAEEINIGFTQNQGGPDLSFGIESDELETLRLATVDLQNYLRTLPGVFDVRNTLQSATPELQIELKPGAERFGLTLADVSRQIRQAFFGEEVQRLPRGGQDVRVMVRFPKSDREDLTTVENMRIRTADGREVPLIAVADAKFAPSYKRIQRRDRQRSSRVTAELREGVDRAAIMETYREEFLPEFRRRHPEAALAQRGDAEEQAEFLGDFLALYAVALFVMYMLLAIAFSSYWQPALIMTAIPFGYMGAAFGHFIFGLDFALFSFFGVGAAAGVVINDNLVLIDYVNRLRANGAGAFEALVRAGVNRFRPIILTSVTTFIGLLPIMFERSTDAQFLKPTIVSLAFGVFFATFVTLIFVPAMYAVGADIARFYRWAWTGEKQPKLGEGASAEHGFARIDDDDVGSGFTGGDGPAPKASRGDKPPVLRPAE